MENFQLQCKNDEEGTARIVVSAVSGGYCMYDTTYIEVKNPMPRLIEETRRALNPGESTTLSWNTRQIQTAKLQVSPMPTINFGSLMEFFDSYPHLCSEQLTSKVLFMLYGRQFLNAEQMKQCERALPAIIKQLSSRQLSDGGYVYWPGNARANSWVTSMAGVALVEADRQGISVNHSCFDKWVEYQEKEARDYRYFGNSDLDQAFRLYSLSKAGRSMWPAMNRLRESKRLTQTAAYCLACAYAIDGRADVAVKLIERAERTPYSRSDGMFQSVMRDEAIKMEAYSLCRYYEKAIPVARRIASQCSGNNYVTQDIAFSTIAMKSFSGLMGNDNMSVSVVENGMKPLSFENLSTMKNVNLSTSTGKVTITNTGKSVLELSLSTAYRPDAREFIKPENKILQVSVSYADRNGMPISVTKLKQDTEFYARVTVVNKGDDIDALAMTYAIPSGWEIWNTRLLGTVEKGVDYFDMRDDHISYYSSLAAGKKITYNIRLRSAYAGKFMLPPVVCEDMYNPSCRAIGTNAWVSVVK